MVMFFKFEGMTIVEYDVYCRSGNGSGIPLAKVGKIGSTEK